MSTLRLVYLALLAMRKVTSTSVKQTLTLYTDVTSWNDANQRCLSQNAKLLKIESSTKLTKIKEWLDWNSVRSIWIGLHEIDPYNTSRVKWSDCSDVTTEYYNIGQPNPSEDNKRCFYIDSSGKYTSSECGMQKAFVCEEDIGNCDFDWNIPKTGCGLPGPIQEELDLTTCLQTCRNAPIASDGSECWTVGFFPGYSGADCWMFHTVDFDECAQTGNFFSHNSITMYMKTCYSVSSVSDAIVDSDVSDEPHTSCRLETTTQMKDTTVKTTMEKLELTTVTHKVTAEETNLTTISISAKATSDSESKPLNIVTTESTTVLPHPSVSVELTDNVSVSCPCECHSNTSLRSNTQLLQWIEDIKKQLLINKRTTSLYRRSLTSADDSRTSASTIGYSGVAIVTTVIVLLIALDFKTLSQQLQQAFHVITNRM